MTDTSQDSLISTNFFFEGQTDFSRGKVRDIYTIGNEYLVMIASDRISAFDHVLPRSIPYKGQVLNQIASKFLDDTKHIVKNWKLMSPDPHVTIGLRCTPYSVEFVVRGYLAGHAWREYKDGKREICGEALPDGLKENDKLPEPILTPTTKAQSGHDLDISFEEIVKRRLIKRKELDQLKSYALQLFEYGSKHAEKQNLILVDTKYEFGKRDDEIYLIDEIHTPDSSRYFYTENYKEIQATNKPQKQLSKEFVRKWLMENGFQGLDGQSIPEMTNDFVNSVSERYIELFESITGQTFEKRTYIDIEKQIEETVNNYISDLYTSK